GHSPAPQPAPAAHALRAGQLEDEARLANARFPNDPEHLAAAPHHPSRQRLHHLHLAATAHERAERPPSEAEAGSLPADETQARSLRLPGTQLEPALEEGCGGRAHPAPARLPACTPRLHPPRAGPPRYSPPTHPHPH